MKSPSECSADSHRDLVERIVYAMEAKFHSKTQMLDSFAAGTVGYRTAKTIAQQLRRMGLKPNARERQPKGIKLETLSQFAEMTEFRLAWLVSGEGPERAGELMPRAELHAALGAAVDAHVSDLSCMGGRAPAPLFSANAEKLLEFLLTAARADAMRQRASAIRAARWRFARDVDRSVAGANLNRPHVDRAIQEMDRLASDEAEESLREGTGPIGLFDLQDYAAEGHVAYWNGRPLPPFQVRALPLQPLSEGDPRPRAVMLRKLRRSAAEAEHSGARAQ